MNTKDINIDGPFFNHLKFADKEIIIVDNTKELNELLEQLNEEPNQ